MRPLFRNELKKPRKKRDTGYEGDRAGGIGKGEEHT